MRINESSMKVSAECFLNTLPTTVFNLAMRISCHLDPDNSILVIILVFLVIIVSKPIGVDDWSIIKRLEKVSLAEGNSIHVWSMSTLHHEPLQQPMEDLFHLSLGWHFVLVQGQLLQVREQLLC